jgi:hypothetical protein
MNEMGVEVFDAKPERFLASLRKEAAHLGRVVRQDGTKAE